MDKKINTKLTFQSSRLNFCGLSRNANLTQNIYMDIDSIRLANLLTLIKRVGGRNKLAAGTGVDKTYISQFTTQNLEKRRAIGKETARKLEEGTGMSHGWMDMDHSSATYAVPVLGNPKPVRMIRLVSWAQAGRWCEMEARRVGGGSDATAVYASAAVSESAFALKVRGDSMVGPSGGRSYPDGCIIVVDPGRTARPGDRIIVKLSNADEAVFKQLEFDGAKRYLKPLNPRYPITEMPDDATIIGVVVLTQTEE